ncbi:class I SAM-dependent methyltransferase [Epilithonimonas xixisoli]|uniref:Ubiquinone/menaquinone biosynthesis C-methylase UbiE n=1 Tax=Epilithonimonas xixisoli TaxID=1476462 RepID=A0A4V3H2U1_9FLAO|nr:class I SAM-dependent methyltransferase [Epilithonimonas xixisoli]TDX86461.1 ubiquinone/menaquinone biosynthesis C-methylase UbiE [Epilithonimonas xixisoli]
MTEQELKILAKNLANPEGEIGKDVAKMMNETNISMTKETIKALILTDNDNVLEIGHGNAGHLFYLLDFAENIQYTGLEISETMKSEAENINQKYLSQAKFQLYDGNKIPFENESFDKVMTVNTIYFWQNPVEFFNEIYRVLKNNGSFVLTFAKKKFMKTLPFTTDFKLYNYEDVEQLIAQTNFKRMIKSDKEEFILSKTGEPVKREYKVLIIKK